MKLSLPGRVSSIQGVRQLAGEAVRSTWLLWALVGLGAAVRLSQYLYNRSLWHDEAALALNLVTRDFAGLLRPLDYLQTAPIGFLFLERLMVLLLGPGEQALRLVPLLGGLGALALFVPVARAVVSREAAPLALLLFVTADKLIYFSTEVKQYSTDVFATLLITLAGLAYLDRPERWRLLLLAALGLALVWLSHPAAFVLGGVGGLLGARHLLRREWGAAAALAAVGALWLVSFAGSYGASLRLLSDAAEMQTSWQDNYLPVEEGGLPLLAMATWLVTSVLGVFQHTIGYPEPVAALGLFAVAAGGASLWAQGRWQLGVVAIPVGLTLLAACLQLYPFYGRLLLFIVPAVLLLVAEGAMLIRRQGRHGPRLAALLIALLCVTSFLEAGYKLLRPVPNQEMRELVAQLRERVEPDDTLYVYRAAVPAFTYYTMGGAIPAGETLRSAVPELDLEGLDRELEGLRGRERVWILISHNLTRGGVSEERFIRHELDQMGRRLDTLGAPGGVIFLYDLSGR